MSEHVEGHTSKSAVTRQADAVHRTQGADAPAISMTWALLRLQRMVGNHAVAQLLGTQATPALTLSRVQRHPGVVDQLTTPHTADKHTDLNDKKVHAGGVYNTTISGVPAEDGSTRTIANEELNSLILKDAPTPGDANAVLDKIKAAWTTDFAEGVNKVAALVEKLVAFEGEARANGIRAFINGYNVQIRSGKTPAEILDVLVGILDKGRTKREEHLITVGGPKLEPGASADHMIDVGVTIMALEAEYDVLARKSAAPPGAHMVHEVDLAFLDSMRGLTDYRAEIEPDSAAKLTGGGGGGEKVLAVGSAGALDFAGQASAGPGTRYYGVLFPKGFINRYGMDLSKLGSKGKSARTPSNEEFSKGSFINDKQRIDIPAEKAFAVRAETATPKGQVHIHYNRLNMKVHGQQMSQLEFFRSWVIGVVEFLADGKVIAYRIFPKAT